MKKMILQLTAAVAVTMPSYTQGMEIFVKTAFGETLSLEVAPEETIGNIVHTVDQYLEERGEMENLYAFEFPSPGDEIELLCKAKQLRKYSILPSEQNIDDMRYIVLTLGNEPLLKLKKYKTPLKNAGDRIDDVHPLHFWRVIFTSDDTISAIHSIKRRKKVWKPFIKGMGDSLEEAADRNNITPEQIEDFAKLVGVDKTLFEQHLYNREWEEFARVLLASVQREEGTDRYDQ